MGMRWVALSCIVLHWVEFSCDCWDTVALGWVKRQASQGGGYHWIQQLWRISGNTQVLPGFVERKKALRNWIKLAIASNFNSCPPTFNSDGLWASMACVGLAFFWFQFCFFLFLAFIQFNFNWRHHVFNWNGFWAWIAVLHLTSIKF